MSQEDLQQDKRGVRFHPRAQRIPRPALDPNTGEFSTGPKQPVVCPHVSLTIRRHWFACCSQGLAGELLVNSSKATFFPRETHGQRGKPTWSASLCDVVHASFGPMAEPAHFALSLHLANDTQKEFTNFEHAGAFEEIVETAEAAGHVIVLDQAVPEPEDSVPSAGILSPLLVRRRPSPLAQLRRPSLVALRPRTRRLVIGKAFDLDLSFVTRRLVVMANPALNLAKVAAFFNSRHKGKYMLYNLTGATDFDPVVFSERVRNVAVRESGTPELRALRFVVNDMAGFIRQSPDHVVGVFCKDGVERSSVVACAWLLHARLVSTSEEAVEYFAARRLVDGKVPLRPAQRRYLGYSQRMVGQAHGNTRILLHGLTLSSVLPVARGPVWLALECGGKQWTAVVAGTQVEFAESIDLVDDVRLSLLTAQDQVLFELDVNTNMLPVDKTTFVFDDLEVQKRAARLVPPLLHLTLHYTSLESHRGPEPSNSSGSGRSRTRRPRVRVRVGSFSSPAPRRGVWSNGNPGNGDEPGSESVEPNVRAEVEPSKAEQPEAPREKPEARAPEAGGKAANVQRALAKRDRPPRALEPRTSPASPLRRGIAHRARLGRSSEGSSSGPLPRRQHDRVVSRASAPDLRYDELEEPGAHFQLRRACSGSFGSLTDVRQTPPSVRRSWSPIDLDSVSDSRADDESSNDEEEDEEEGEGDERRQGKGEGQGQGQGQGQGGGGLGLRRGSFSSGMSDEEPVFEDL